MAVARSDFVSLTDQYMDTAAYGASLDPAFQALFLQDPKELDQRRFNGYRYFINWHRGRQWEEQGEINPAYGAQNIVNQEFHRRTWNVSKNIVDKLVDFMAKDEWKIVVPPQLEPGDVVDVEQQSPVHDILDTVWTANNKMEFTYRMLQMGCVTGDCFVKVSYDENFYADGVGELVFQVLDSRLCLPFFDGMQRDKMVGCRIQYPTYMVEAGGEKKPVTYTEVHTAGNIVTLLDNDVQSILPNPLGEMLIIHIKNEPRPWERFGVSDYYDLILPNKELNENLSNLSEILAYHAAPITVVKGARLNTLEKGARKMWTGIPKDGDVYNLNLDADLSSSLNYIALIKQHIFETGCVPEEALGQLQAISNTSGAALQLQYQPIVDRAARKQPQYGRGLQEINRLILRFYEAVGALELPEKVSPALKYHTKITWGDGLPRDRSLELADISTEMGLQIESKKGALVRLGEDNPDQKLEEIKQEQLEQAETEFMQAGLAGFGDPEAGPDGMGGAPNPENQPGKPNQPGNATGTNPGTQASVSGAVKAAKTNPITQGSQTSVQAVKRASQQVTGARSGKPQRN